jgi:ADP-ribose pyrophosphatase YjhB (NUDIX family)
MPGRTDYYDDPEAPAPNSLVPAASAIVADQDGGILLHRRADSGQWALPGGAMQLGESAATTAVRETKEETGLDIEIVSLVGIYTDPRHVIAYADGEVRQQFNVCFAARVIGGTLAASSESTALEFVRPGDLLGLDIHPTTRRRIEHYQAHQSPYFD